MRTCKNNEKGNMLVVALIISLVAAMIISAFMQSSFTTVNLASRIKRKVASESIAEGGVDLARSLLIQSAQTGNTLLDDIHTAGASGFELETLGGDTDRYRRMVFAFEEVGKPTSIELGPFNYRIFSTVEQIDTGVRFTIQASVSLAKETYAKIAFGMIHPSGTGPFNFFPSTYSGEVHFGNFGAAKPTFLSGTHLFSDPVTFESADPTPFAVTGTTGLTFEKGFETGSSFTTAFDPTTIMTDVCANATASFSGWNDGQDLCLYFKDNIVEKYACAGDPDLKFRMGYQSANTAYGAIGTLPLDTKTIPDEGAIICSDHNIGVKGIYSKGVTVASQENLIFWGDFVSRHQATATYTAGLIANRNIIIPADVPSGNYLTEPLDYGGGNQINPTTGAAVPSSTVFFELSGMNPSTYVWAGTTATTNFTVNHQFVGYPTVPVFTDQDFGKSYQANAISNASIVMNLCPAAPGGTQDFYSCANVPGILDIDGAVMAADGILDVANLNDEDLGANGRAIPTANNLYFSGFLNMVTVGGLFKYYDDANMDGKITLGVGSPDTRDGNPKYCFGGEYPATCRFGGELSRGRADALSINGGLIVKDFSSISKYPCGYHSGSWYDRCGFDRKQITYNPLLRKYPPPGYPKPTNKFNTFVNWTKKYVDQQGPSNFQL